MEQKKKIRNTGEYDHQCALFRWARIPAVQRQNPGLDLLSCSLNGIPMTQAQAWRAVNSGMLAGEFDIRLPVARGGYHSLTIEMKYGKNGATKRQEWYHRRMAEEGVLACFVWNWLDAKSLIVRYLKGLEVRDDGL